MPEMWISVTQHSIDQLHEALEGEKRQRVGVEAENARLRRLFDVYGSHYPGCPASLAFHAKCECGYEEARDALAAVQAAPANEV